MLSRLRWILVVLALLLSSREGHGQEDEARLRLGVSLVDGSYIVGEPTRKSVSVRTSFAKMNVFLEHVRFIRMDETGNALLELRNGDKLTGVAEIGSLEIDSIFGKKSIDPGLINGVLVMGAYSSDTNLALAEYGATASCSKYAGFLNDGNSTDYSGSRGFAYGSCPCTFTITFPRSTKISHLRVLLWDGDSRSYKYRLQVTEDGSNWITVADYSDEGRKGWQAVSFESRRIVAFRLEGLHNSVNTGFHIVEMEAYQMKPGGELKPSKQKGT
ncbi:MAG: discoidin domain-containing protein [Kiritimatiellia bacterium]|nr:discoidin domain-containing protein [Kiritimatiellia bacterium]